MSSECDDDDEVIGESTSCARPVEPVPSTSGVARVPQCMRGENEDVLPSGEAVLGENPDGGGNTTGFGDGAGNEPI